MTFDKTNYLFMGIGILLIALGLVLLSGGGSADPEVFNDSIFNTQRIVIAPLTMLLGFGVEFYAILRKPKAEQDID